MRYAHTINPRHERAADCRVRLPQRHRVADGPGVAPQDEVAATAALAFYRVSAAYEHSCGLTTNSQAYCWGDNIHGEVGDGVSRRVVTPVAVAGGLKFRQVTTGFGYSCGVTTEYRAYCWGLNDIGQLGDATTMDRATPVAVRGGLHFIQISAGACHTCALSYPDRRAYCWGGNYHGALGDGTTSGRLMPVLAGYYRPQAGPVALLRSARPAR